MKDDPRASPSGSGGSSGSDDPVLQALASAPPLRPPLRIGERLGGRYLIEAYLGRGGMGEVYRALDETLGERVALKLVHGSRDEAELRNEVRLAQKATHANVCRIFDLEDVDGRQILKMEFVAGETLAARLSREGKLSIAESVRIARGIALGLQAAHASGIVHFDLKPGNLMLDGNRVVLMDFGLARPASAPGGKLRGTTGYIAPEILRHEPADHRADLYALGCVLFEMLSGAPVFESGSRGEINVRHLLQTAPPLRTPRKDAPAWLATAVAKLLAKSPDHRGAGMKLLLAGPRSPLWLAVPSIAIAVLLAGTGIWRVVHGPTWIPEVFDYPVFEENIGAPAFSPDGKWFVFESTRAGGPLQLYAADRRAGAATLLLTLPEVEAPIWARDGEHIFYTIGGYVGARFVRQKIGGDPPALIGDPELIAHAFYGDECGDAIVYVDTPTSGWRVMLRENGGSTRQLFAAEPNQVLLSLACSPDGHRIAIVLLPTFDGYGDILLIDRAGKVDRRTSDLLTAPAISWTPGGESLIAARKVAGKLQLFELQLAGGEPRRVTFDEGPDLRSAVSSDGRDLLFTRDSTYWMPTVGTLGNEHDVACLLGSYAFPRAIDYDTAVVQRDTADGAEVDVIKLANGAMTKLGPGRAPFPSHDRSTVYFVDSKRENELRSMPSSGGESALRATLPGNIKYGGASEDGIHLLISTPGKQLGYFLPPGGEPREEVEGGIVTVAPQSGWRAVTALSGTDRTLELRIVPPGAGLDKPAQRVPVLSFYNGWLDAHRLSYCEEGDCKVLDVVSGETTVLKTATWINVGTTVMPEGGRVLSIGSHAHVTLHTITNFADR